jgi:hypothetical protein
MVISVGKFFIADSISNSMSINEIVADYELPLYISLKKQRDYGGYQNKAEMMPWCVKDIPFKELSRGLCGYCKALSTKATTIGNWLKSDMPELARTLFHEEFHKVNSNLSEYAVQARENNAFAPDDSPYRKQLAYSQNLY